MATISADQPARRGAAVAAIDQARKLNPLEPGLDVIKAVLLYYGRGDAEGAADLLTATLTRNPLYEPALARIEELRWATGHSGGAVNLGEQALSRDPHSADARQILVLAYLDVDELRAAESWRREMTMPIPAPGRAPTVPATCKRPPIWPTPRPRATPCRVPLK